ncbi:chaperone protein TorD [Azoarcus sp. Aa7]|nr:chaperone protein TorD [Azoarcus sp. Aa7]
MMDARDIESLTERGEFYLCLARAFLTPHTVQAFDGLRDALADDLGELAASLGYACADTLADYRAAIAAIPDPLTLLERYSALFVTPPRTIQINTACYLDGALNGGTVAAMDEAYRRCGVERGADFHDLSDHVSVQLEFVALLYLRSAQALEAGTPLPPAHPEHFLHDYVARWLPAFIRDLEAAHAGPNPWLPLTRVLAAAVAHDACAETLPTAELRARRAIGKARHDRAMRGVTAEDMAFIARKLREKGLSTDHLAIPPELRDEVRGYSRGTPPGPRKGSRYE